MRLNLKWGKEARGISIPPEEVLADSSRFLTTKKIVCKVYYSSLYVSSVWMHFHAS